MIKETINLHISVLVHGILISQLTLQINLPLYLKATGSVWDLPHAGVASGTPDNEM